MDAAINTCLYIACLNLLFNPSSWDFSHFHSPVSTCLRPGSSHLFRQANHFHFIIIIHVADAWQVCSKDKLSMLKNGNGGCGEVPILFSLNEDVVNVSQLQCTASKMTNVKRISHNILWLPQNSKGKSHFLELINYDTITYYCNCDYSDI